jgi:hypothetical protein
MVKKINLSKVGSFISIIKTEQIWNIDDLYIYYQYSQIYILKTVNIFLISTLTLIVTKYHLIMLLLLMIWKL